ncbi:MAG: hypothetical protein ABFS28_16660 [Bacteroidota bacterium]
MKASIRIIFLLVVLLLNACEKYTENLENEFKFDGEIHELSWGIVDYFESENDYYYHAHIVLLPGTVYFDEETHKVQGEGHAVHFFDLISSTKDLSGVYQTTTHSWAYNDQEGDFSGVRLACDCQFPIENGSEIYNPYYAFHYEVELELNQTGNEIEITFKGDNESGDSMVLSFKGSVMESDMIILYDLDPEI